MGDEYKYMGSVGVLPQNNLPYVSCIMPTYGRPAFAAQAVRYFLRQDYPACELIVVDDGPASVEPGLPVDPRVRCIRLDQRLTTGAKRNRGCAEARGEVLLNWDDDDWSAPHRIRAQVAALLQDDADISGLNRLIYYDLVSGRALRYVYPEGLSPWVSGNSLCYTRGYWSANRFDEHKLRPELRFVWSDRPKRIAVVPEETCFVGIIHGANTAPKRIDEPCWHPYPLADLQALLGDDWAFYQRKR